MTTFEVAFTSGVSLQEWDDPVSGSKPSRLNALDLYPFKRRVGTTGSPITVTATSGGVSGPLDATLGGLLFTAAMAESPESPPPAFSNPAGQSSVQTFTPGAAGHYCFVIRREDNGGVFLHVDVQDP